MKKEDMIKTNFFWKNWRDGYFSEHEEITTKWDLDKNVFVPKATFVVKHVSSIFSKKGFSKNFKKSDLFEKGCQKKKYRNMMIELLNNIQSQKSEKEILGGICWASGFCFPEKVNLILFERTNTIFKKQSEKGTKQKNDRTNKVLQREMTNSKFSDFSTKNEK